MSGIVGSKFNHRGSGVVGSVGTDGQHLLSSGAGKKHVFETVASASYDDTNVRMDLLSESLKAAIEQDLPSYNLPNALICNFQNDDDIGSETTGDRAIAEYWSTIVRTHKQFQGSGTYSRGSVTDIALLAVGGGGGGGGDTSGGAGAGGLVFMENFDISGDSTWAYSIGAGGAGTSSYADGSNGGNTTFGDVTATGGGGGGSGGGAGNDGGSGGAPRRGESSDTGDSTQATTQEGQSNVGHGNESGIGDGSGGSGGGGGAGAVGGSDTYTADGRVDGGAGGVGLDCSAVFGRAVGDDGWFAGGGGGGSEGKGGGSRGGDNFPDQPYYPQMFTGGGAGGGRDTGATGGSGTLIISEVTGDNATGTLISTAQTANASQTEVSGLIVYRNFTGTATLGTDIKVYFTCNGGTNWTESTLSAAGTFATLPATLLMAKCAKATCTAGTDVRYKVVWANQATGTKETQLHAIGMAY